MARSHKSYLSKESNLKMEHKLIGYYGESCWNSKSRRWFQRLVHKANRRAAKQFMMNELQNLA